MDEARHRERRPGMRGSLESSALFVEEDRTLIVPAATSANPKIVMRWSGVPDRI